MNCHKTGKTLSCIPLSSRSIRRSGEAKVISSWSLLFVKDKLEFQTGSERSDSAIDHDRVFLCKQLATTLREVFKWHVSVLAIQSSRFYDRWNRLSAYGSEHFSDLFFPCFYSKLKKKRLLDFSTWQVGQSYYFLADFLNTCLIFKKAAFSLYSKLHLTGMAETLLKEPRSPAPADILIPFT